VIEFFKKEAIMRRERDLSKKVFTKISFLFLLVFFFYHGVSVASPLEDCKEHAKYGIPDNDPVLLCREAYLLSHNSEYKIPIWAAYHFKSDLLDSKIKRSGQFRADPDLPKGERAELMDYKDKCVR
jgi:endonuclease G